MNLKKLQILIEWQFVALLFFLTMAELQAQIASPPLQIATSNHHLATAYNSGRRMVRDSKDHRYVVYQDLRGDLPIICLVHSADGKAWSQPDTLAEGAFPSLAIDQTDRLFLVWQAADTAGISFTYSNNSGTSWHTPYRAISQVTSEKTQFPVIEAGRRRLHVAWQQDFYLQPWRCVQDIFYSFIALDSLESSFVKPINISRSEHDSKFPSIAHNLVFEVGNLHIVWYDSTNIDSTMILYQTINEMVGPGDSHFRSGPGMISYNCGSDVVHPAISVEAGEFVHVVWGHSNKKSFHSLLLKLDFDMYVILIKRFEIKVPAEPFISIDDAYVKSSALVWMNDNEIYYLQTRDAQQNSPYIPVSQIDTIRSMYPGVCYKNFNQDSLDVVWSEGNNAPYKIMYRRMKKNYSYQEVEHTEAENQLPQKLILKPNYPNPFNSFTTIRYGLPHSCFVTLKIYNFLGQKVRTIVAENQFPGEYQINWNGHDDNGNLLPSGIYLSQLKADNQILIHKIALIK